MMKIRDWCLVVLLCLPNMTFAHTDAVGIRVFDTHSYNSGYDERAEFWSGCPVIGDAIDTDCLADKAYDFAQSTGALSRVPERNQFRESYKDLFLRWNDLGSTMSVLRFMRKATGTGFYLPQGRGRFTPLSYVEWSSIRGDVDLLQQQMRTLEPESAQSLRERINALEDRLVGIDSSTASLLGTLSTLETVVKNLPSLSQAELDAQKAELDNRLSGLVSRVTRLEETKADKADVASIKAQLSSKASQSDVTSLAARMSSLENSPSVAVPFTTVQNPDYTSEVKKLWSKFWWILPILLLLGVLVWLLKSRKNTPVTEVVTTVDTPSVVVPSTVFTTSEMDQYKTLRKQVQDEDTGVLARVGRLEELVGNNENGVLVRLDRTEKEVEVLREESDYMFQLTSNRKRVENVPTEAVIEALRVGQHLDLPVKGSYPPGVVRVVRGTLESADGAVEEMLFIYGVKDLNNGVKPKATFLSLALMKGLKDYRVEGISPQSTVGLTPESFRRQVRKTAVRKRAA